MAGPLALRIGDREKLARMASSRAESAALARRARIVLLAVEGMAHTEIAERCGTSVPTVRHRRSRYRAGGVRALEDRARSGRPRTVNCWPKSERKKLPVRDISGFDGSVRTESCPKTTHCVAEG